MNKSVVIGGMVILAVVIIGLVMWANRAEAPAVQESDLTDREYLETPLVTSAAFQPAAFTQVKGAHFVSSEPANNEVVTTGSQSVNINFNFDLTAPSAIAVTRDAVDVVRGPATIAPDKLSMSVPVEVTQTGNYVVNYKGCWPDGSCDDGSFGFSVDLNP